MDFSEKVTADRSTLISWVEWLELQPPVLVAAGERYWADMDRMLFFVESDSSPVRSFPLVTRVDGRR